MAEKKLNLLADFPAVSTQQWLDKINADLKGADFNKKLVWKTNEGFSVMPFYRAEDIEALQTKESVPGKFPFVRGTKADNEWFVRQDITVDSAKDANAKALDVLNKGVNSLGFILKSEELSASYIETLLDGICAECVELNFRICINSAAQLATLLTDYYKAKAYDVKKLQGSISFDPINRMLQAGKDLTKEEIVAKAKALIEAAAGLPFYRVIAVNATNLS